MKRIVFISTLIFALLLTACGPSAADLAATAEMAAGQTEAARPSNTPALEPTATPIPEPTAMPEPEDPPEDFVRFTGEGFTIDLHILFSVGGQSSLTFETELVSADAVTTVIVNKPVAAGSRSFDQLVTAVRGQFIATESLTLVGEGEIDHPKYETYRFVVTSAEVPYTAYHIYYLVLVDGDAWLLIFSTIEPNLKFNEPLFELSALSFRVSD